MDSETLTTLPDGVSVRIKNRFGWWAILPLGSTPPEFRALGFYLDFAGRLILQHEITRRRAIYAPPYAVARPAPEGRWLVYRTV